MRKPIDTRWPSKLSPVTAWPVAAFDGFDGRLDLPWKPIRHDPTHVSLDKHPGKLTIITQRGSIHGDEKHDEYGGGVQAKNIFVIDNPFSSGEDFAMTTCVENFTPQIPYQQAGLICYDDDDNYLKCGYEFCWPKGAGHTFTCVREIAAESNFDVADAKPGITKYWLRIIKRGNKYQYAYSYDGEDYVTVGEQAWGDGKPKKLGLLAKNGGNPDASELECQFDFFQLQCPNEGKSINWDRGSEKRTMHRLPRGRQKRELPVLTVYHLKYAKRRSNRQGTLLALCRAGELQVRGRPKDEHTDRLWHAGAAGEDPEVDCYSRRSPTRRAMRSRAMCRRQSSDRWDVGQVSNLPCVSDLRQFGRLETCPTLKK